jgi:purine catabolism regulator
VGAPAGSAAPAAPSGPGGRVLRSGAAPPSLLALLGPGAAAFADAVLAPLVAAPDGEMLRRSLHAYLTAHGALAVASEQLGVHRHTLRTRLRRTAGLLGRDLDDPGVRAELWVALTAAPGTR